MFFIAVSNFVFGQSDSLSFENQLHVPARDCAHSHICCDVGCFCCPHGLLQLSKKLKVNNSPDSLYVAFKQNPVDSSMIKFAQKVYSLERKYMKGKIYPADTINIENKQYILKFVEKTGNAPTYEETLRFASNITYSCVKYGNDYVIIGLSRNTAIPHEKRYYYEIISK